MVMVFFVIFSMMGLAFLKMASHENIQALNNYHRVQALYNAEAGIHKGLWLANKVSPAAATFADGTVSVVYDSVNLTLTAIGTSGSMQDSIRVTLYQSGTTGPIRNKLLFVVWNIPPGSQHVLRQNLMESWGYSVTQIDGGDSQATFDAALDTVDVVYVPKVASDSEIGTKLRDTVRGVVSEKKPLDAEFRFAANDGQNYSGTQLDITDNSHYITSPFSTGPVTILSSSYDLIRFDGDLAPGLQVLAEQPTSSAACMAVIETGGALYGMGTAAGRRVRLGWGGNSFDFNALNANGQTLMKRAIEWAAGGPIGGGASTVTILTWDNL